MRSFVVFVSALVISLCITPPAPCQNASAPIKLRVAIVGLVHGHVQGFLDHSLHDPTIDIVGIADADPALSSQYAARYGFDHSLLFTDLATMLDRARPQAVLVYTNTYDHRRVVEICAKHGVHVMMEKPLAVSLDDALAIQKAANRGKIQVLVNYETTWYPSHAAMWDLLKTQHAAGNITKMVAMDGHQGPQEIGVGPEFFAWLTDPVKNGDGALFDFGCYGANLMTWMMDNQRPLAVTALVQTIKPHIYPHVDDQATVLLDYPKAQGIIQASWAWPFSRKDFEVYGERGYAVATGGDALRVRLPGGQEESRTLAALPPSERDSISYLTAVVRGQLPPSGLSSLENNLIVTEILDAARESARTGKTILLKDGLR